ncbi:ABC-three component system protein [Acinetobacter baumannii]|uniref:ABC-three component system protein n=1 Tax=Acinetobacter baumannii TaxID=470 RepID=UPI000BF89512|nr:ABC-three component system protein [Acinetobacter baumannii]
MYSSVNQNENQITAEQVKLIAGDDKSTVNNLNFSPNNTTRTIAQMYQRILENSDNFLDDETYQETKNSLFRYLNPKSAMITLEEKLKAADREELIEDALELKEATNKFITMYEASSSGQYILVHILSTIATKHKAYVIPAIKTGKPRDVIDAIIDSMVIGNALSIIDGTGKSITSERMYGLMYYLAGNCHIKWTI